MIGYGHYSDDEVELEVGGKVYNVSVEADCSYWHHKEKLYLRNGDPGYPEDEEFELADVSAEWEDENGNKVESTKEMESALEKYLNGLNMDRWEWEGQDRWGDDPFDYFDKADYYRERGE